MSPSTDVEVRRSARRTRTVSAYRRDGKLIVMIPDTFSQADELTWVAKMADKVERRARNARGCDDDLMERAQELSSQYLDGRAVPSALRWVANMSTRWASCSTGTGEIRVSQRVQSMPDWVVDYVLVHELAHLIEPSHNPLFWRLVGRYPKAERAKGYLEGVIAVAGESGTRG